MTNDNGKGSSHRPPPVPAPAIPGWQYCPCHHCNICLCIFLCICLCICLYLCLYHLRCPHLLFKLGLNCYCHHSWTCSADERVQTIPRIIRLNMRWLIYPQLVPLDISDFPTTVMIFIVLYLRFKYRHDLFCKSQFRWVGRYFKIRRFVCYPPCQFEGYIVVQPRPV